MGILKIAQKSLLILLIMLFACTRDEFLNRPFTGNSLFPGTERIIVNEYSYYSNGVLYIVDDAITSVQKPDTFPRTPSFSWNPTDAKLVVAAVFNSRIQVNSSGIINKNNTVWMWNTGMNTGKEGSIAYSDGRSVKNGIILDKEQVTPLYSDSLYTWAVWAWDDSGTKITKSSREMGFIVK